MFTYLYYRHAYYAIVHRKCRKKNYYNYNNNNLACVCVRMKEKM